MSTLVVGGFITPGAVAPNRLTPAVTGWRGGYGSTER
jgi:hypothetical protein